MIDRTITDLMNTELDGVNTAAQSEKLRAYLEESAEAREYFEALERTLRRLDADPDAEPPPHLFHRVIDAIPFGRVPRARVAATTRTLGGLLSWFLVRTSRPRFAFPATFTLGLVAGVIVFSVISYNVSPGGDVSHLLDISQFSGTIGGVEQAGSLDAVGALEVDLDAVAGQIRLHHAKSSLLAEVSLDCRRPVEWVLEFDSERLSLTGFSRADDVGDVSVADGRIRVRQTGPARYLLAFHQGAGEDGGALPAGVKIFEDGHLIFNKQLRREMEK